MPKHLEVRASVSFGVFRQGQVYEIDIDDGRMMSLLGVGYLEPTSDLEEDDARVDLRDSTGGAGLHGVRVVGSPESEAVSDVADHLESGGDPELGTPKRRGGRRSTGGEDSSGVESSGSAGKP